MIISFISKVRLSSLTLRVRLESLTYVGDHFESTV